MKVENKTFTIKDVSTILGVHPSTIYRMLKRGELTGWKIGSDWRFNIEDVERWRLEHAHAKTATGSFGHKPNKPTRD